METSHDALPLPVVVEVVAVVAVVAVVGALAVEAVAVVAVAAVVAVGTVEAVVVVVGCPAVALMQMTWTVAMLLSLVVVPMKVPVPSSVAYSEKVQKVGSSPSSAPPTVIIYPAQSGRYQVYLQQEHLPQSQAQSVLAGAESLPKYSPLLLSSSLSSSSSLLVAALP